MQKLFSDIIEFHVKFGLEQNEPCAKLTDEEWKLRHRRLFDEHSEFLTAQATNDKPEMLDGLVDLVYIALGTIYRRGWPGHFIFDAELSPIKMYREAKKPTRIKSRAGVVSDNLLSKLLESYADAASTGDDRVLLSTLVQVCEKCISIATSRRWDFHAAWDRVHAANMAKERGQPNNSKYGSGFDIIKPEGWKAPDLSDLV